MGSRNRHVGRSSRVVLGALLVLPLAAAPVTAQDDSLCDLVSLDDIHALGELRYVVSEYAGPEVCVLDAAPDQEGPHGITIWVNEVPFGMTFEEMRDVQLEQVPTYEDATVGDLPAIFTPEMGSGANVMVGLGENVVTIFASTDESAEGSGLDQADYALAVAEVVLPSLADAGIGEPATMAAELPTVEGLAMRTTRSLAGSEIDADVDDALRQLLDVLLAESGASYEQMAILDATVSDEASGSRLGSYLTIGIEGAEASALAPVLVDWLAQLQGEAFGSSTESLAGKDAIEVSNEGEAQGYIYAEGDTLHLITLPREAAEALIQALP